MLSVLLRPLKDPQQLQLQLTTFAAATVGATRGKKNLNKLANDAAAEAEKKRRRRAEKARLRAWTAEASWDIRVGDTLLDSQPVTAQAPDGHSWQRRWRQNFSRRKSRNKGWEQFRQAGRTGRDTWHHKAWGHMDTETDRRWTCNRGWERTDRTADYQPFEHIWQDVESMWQQRGWQTFSSAQQQSWDHQHRQRDQQQQQRQQTERQHPRQLHPDATVAKHMMVLGITTGQLTSPSLKAAFHACARAWHPDLHEGDSKKVAEAKFKEASEAYDALHAHIARSRTPAA